MSAGVASFTRLWFGVASATALRTTDPIEAPDELIASLDESLLLPDPVAGWMF